MLELDELFKKRPFIYVVDNVYYAFGSGVCAICDDGRKKHITLPSRYFNYTNALTNDELSDSDAFDIFRKVQFVADVVKDDQKDHLHLKEKFSQLGFSEDNKRTIEKQLKDMVHFFQKHNLGERYSEIGM